MYGAAPYFTVDLTSGATETSSLDLGAGWDHAKIAVPTMASGSLYIHGSYDNTTFFRMVSGVQTTNVSDGETLVIDSSCTQRIVPIPLAGCRYIKIESSSGATDTTTVFNIICN